MGVRDEYGDLLSAKTGWSFATTVRFRFSNRGTESAKWWKLKDQNIQMVGYTQGLQSIMTKTQNSNYNF